ncbi:hypothetical protein FisN_UnNu087, partial [Fistulifera solaris]
MAPPFDDLVQEIANDLTRVLGAPPLLTQVDGADPIGFIASEAHLRLKQVFGDWIHDNDGTQLHGSLSAEEDYEWQKRYEDLCSSSPNYYMLPLGGDTGIKFLNQLVAEFQAVRLHRTANFERVIVFVQVVLASKRDISDAKAIRLRINDRLELWAGKQYQLLVDDTLLERKFRIRGPVVRSDLEIAERFRNTVEFGRIKKAMQQLMESTQEGSSVLDPESIDLKSGKPVRDVLDAKHPPQRVPDLENDEDHSAFEKYDTTPDAVPLRMTAQSIEEAARNINGSGGPSGIDAKMLQNWLICFGDASFALRQELAAWTEWLTNGDPPSTTSMLDSQTDPEAVVLVDARNAFNELNRLVMLWTVRHLYPAGARLIFHSYRHTPILFLRRGEGKPCIKLHSREGITQGDPMSMIIYGLTLVPLAKRIREATKDVVQPWYADDVALAGPASQIDIAMKLLIKYGPDRGYYPEPEKSQLVCIDPESRLACSRLLAEYKFSCVPYARYLGGFIGDRSYLGEWLCPKIEAWISKVEALSMVARTEPQAAYAAFTISLQNEWAYIQRVVPGCEEFLKPLEVALRTSLLPAILGERSPTVGELREITTLATK